MDSSRRLIGASAAAAAAAAVAAAAVAAHCWWRRNVLPLGPCCAACSELPVGDQLVRLPSNGLTRYTLANAMKLAAGDAIVVLVHGISYPGVDMFRGLANALEGRCVLAYDIAGRGWSHVSGEPMDLNLYVQQLEELLDALGCQSRDIELVGWSLGATIASQFAYKHAQDARALLRARYRVKKLVMLAPGGLFSSGFMRTCRIDEFITVLRGSNTRALLQRAMIALFVRTNLKVRQANEMRGMADGGRLVRLLWKHIDENRVLVRAWMSSLAHCPEIFDNRRVLRELGASDLEILLLFAKHDNAVGPPPGGVELDELMPRAQWRVLDAPDLDHAMHVTHREIVEPLIVKFLRSGHV